MTLLLRFNALAHRAVALTAVVLFIALFGIVCAQIFFRYVLGEPLIWSEELARYVFVWICFLGWLMASYGDDHIAITLLRDRVPADRRRLLLAAFETAGIVFAVILVWRGWEIAARNLTVTTVTLPVTFAWVYAIVPLAGLLAIAHALGRLAALVTGAPGTAAR